jgi:ATP-dependent Zn protease
VTGKKLAVPGRRKSRTQKTARSAHFIYVYPVANYVANVLSPMAVATYMRSMERERYTAFHEAGHAVIGRVLGLVCGAATIVPDARGVGCATTKSPLATLDAWDARGRCRYNGHDLKSVYRAYIMELMAGREAAELCCGPGGDFIGDGGDIRQIETLIHRTYDLDRESWPSPPVGDFDLDRLRKATRGLCIRHREKVERVAQVLIKHRTLSPEAIDSFMRTT